MRETMMQKNISEGIRDAGSNSNGAMAGFMGVGMGMNASGGFMQAASATNMQQLPLSLITLLTVQLSISKQLPPGLTIPSTVSL